MVRFRDVAGVDAIAAHNQILDSNGKVAWGLWLKDFENQRSIVAQLNALGSLLAQIYIADTSQKANPVVYVASVGKVIITDNMAVDARLVPDYYRDQLSEVPIWFELTSRLIRVDVDHKLTDVLGVPTIYFLEYNAGVISNIEPQREFDKLISNRMRYLLHLTDIHLGEDHGFRQPGPRPRTDVSPQLSLSNVLRDDIRRVGATGQIAGVVVSGDIVTKGGWDQIYRFGNSELSGSQATRLFLQELSDALDVPPECFFMVPGNHDIVRQSGSDPAVLRDYLLDYKHESGFREIREDFCGIYKLSPLNYVIKMEIGGIKILLGMLNSAYLNDHVTFKEYGFVGDDAEHVFRIMAEAHDFTKILVLHHHVLPVYEREILSDGQEISMTLDAAKIMRRCQEVGVSFVLHGHQHSTKLFKFASWTPEMEREFKDCARAITVLAGGSSGAKSGRVPTGESNTYALLDVAELGSGPRVRRIYPTGRLGDDW